MTSSRIQSPCHLPVRRIRRDRLRQHGSVAVMAAIFLSVIVILLSSIDIGYMFYMRRDLQKTADLAALAGAQMLASSQTFTSTATTCGSGDPPVLAARANAQTNGFATGTPSTAANTLTVTCGRWDPVANAAMAPNYFSTPTAPNTRLNAVKVILSQSVPTFFGWGTHTINGQAIASISDPYAAFSVGSKLLALNGGVVPGLLSAIGLNLNGTSLVSYNGLANVSVTPNGLLQALGFQIPLHADVGTVTQILQASTAGCSNGMCTLQALLGAITTVGGQQDLISALGGLTVGQLNLMIPLLSDASGQGGLFVLANIADAQSALNANVNALNVLNTAIGIANSHRFGSVNLGASLPGVATVTTQVGIVEPPSIGIGGIGTTAFTAQVRLYTRIQSNLLNLGLLNIDLPLIIDVVNGLGTLTDMCTAKDASGNDLATIQVQAPVLSLCAGSVNNVVDGSTVFSTKGACKQNLTNWPMVNVLGGVLTVNKAIAIDALANNSSVTLSKGQTVTTGNNSLQIGTTLSNLFSALTGALAGSLFGGGGVNNNNLAAGLLNGQGLGAAQTMVTNALSSLNSFVSGLSTSVTGILGSLLTVNVLGILTNVGGLVNNLLNTIGQVVSGLLCLGNSQCILSNQLAGSQTSGGATISNALITTVGLLINLLQPILNVLGGALSTILNGLLGIQLGLVDVNLMDLNCGGTSVKLVY
ncbi:tadE-like family protein [Collimonas arenae]|uniref:TadE-like family protein n=1 Tax=Collimonas arenae TaxID=279058 RepID=A0A127QF35_9BURK|nr:pilus assembly protein TadG-related protein [Collimonas arenae]AMP08651.1 tadE-like family protein [Collimonas arenae]